MNEIEFNNEFKEILANVKDYTMVSVERLYSNYNASLYISKNNIAGSIVECGVWKGGSSMMMLNTLKNRKDESRDVYLYDTYEGMSEPTEFDKKTGSTTLAMEKWKEMSQEEYNEWCYSSIEEVQKNVKSVGYDLSKVHFIKGKVEDTIPATLPEKISILRLDTDWYESTKHEMVHLFPRLVSGGVLIIDDYGSWEGARKAIDEYIEHNSIKILLNRIDSTGRIAIKL